MLVCYEESLMIYSNFPTQHDSNELMEGTESKTVSDPEPSI